MSTIGTRKVFTKKEVIEKKIDMREKIKVIWDATFKYLASIDIVVIQDEIWKTSVWEKPYLWHILLLVRP